MSIESLIARELGIPEDKVKYKTVCVNRVDAYEHIVKSGNKVFSILVCDESAVVVEDISELDPDVDMIGNTGGDLHEG